MLGLPQNANSEAINRAYKRKVAEARGDDAAKARIESAHSTIMMSQLTARMKVRRASMKQVLNLYILVASDTRLHPKSGKLQGGLQVDKDVKYADRAVYFPWRPRYFANTTSIDSQVASEGFTGFMTSW